MLEELIEESLENPNFLKAIHALMLELSVKDPEQHNFWSFLPAPIKKLISLKAGEAVASPASINYRGNNFCYWAGMLRQPGWRTYVWRHTDGHIVGMANISFLQTPKSYFAYIHDVVVLRAYRGQGIARALTEKLIELATNFGVDCIELTSGRKRKAARALYEKLGFKKRDTGVFRLKLRD